LFDIFFKYLKDAACEQGPNSASRLFLTERAFVFKEEKMQTRDPPLTVPSSKRGLFFDQRDNRIGGDGMKRNFAIVLAVAALALPVESRPRERARAEANAIFFIGSSFACRACGSHRLG